MGLHIFSWNESKRGRATWMKYLREMDQQMDHYSIWLRMHTWRMSCVWRWQQRWLREYTHALYWVESSVVGAGNIRWLWILYFRTSRLVALRIGQKFVSERRERFFHVNQAYGKFVAKQYNKSATSTLSLLWRSSFLKDPIDQYSLIHVGIAVVCTNT